MDWNNDNIVILTKDNEDEPPPEPAPPEVPPRCLSMHTLKKRQLVIDKLSGDQKHEEFIPSIKSGESVFFHFNCFPFYITCSVNRVLLLFSNKLTYKNRLLD